MKSALTILIWFGIFIGAMTYLNAQPCRLPERKAWIVVSNATGDRDTVWFGFDSTATCGEDPGLCEFYPAEPCGAPNTFFCIFWSSPCGPGPGAIVLWRYDFRAYVSPTKIDTHRMSFQPGDSGYPLIFRWSRDAVLAICDSAVLRYWSGVSFRQRMDLTDSLVITDSTVFQVHLFRYGQRLTPVQVGESGLERPANFALFQNYPNPFNASTTIRFDIPASGVVSLKVYNLLGQQVATLVNEVKQPGRYKVVWDASGQASGVYFYRLRSGEFAATRKLAIIR